MTAQNTGSDPVAAHRRVSFLLHLRPEKGAAAVGLIVQEMAMKEGVDGVNTFGLWIGS